MNSMLSIASGVAASKPTCSRPNATERLRPSFAWYSSDGITTFFAGAEAWSNKKASASSLLSVLSILCRLLVSVSVTEWPSPAPRLRLRDSLVRVSGSGGVDILLVSEQTGRDSVVVVYNDGFQSPQRSVAGAEAGAKDRRVDWPLGWSACRYLGSWLESGRNLWISSCRSLC
jgi:hypothetical protein